MKNKDSKGTGNVKMRVVDRRMKTDKRHREAQEKKSKKSRKSPRSNKIQKKKEKRKAAQQGSA